MGIMSRPNHIELVEHLYRINPNLSDGKIRSVVATVFDCAWPTYETIAVWKTKCRKKGIPIPDLRRTREENKK